MKTHRLFRFCRIWWTPRRQPSSVWAITRTPPAKQPRMQSTGAFTVRSKRCSCGGGAHRLAALSARHWLYHVDCVDDCGAWGGLCVWHRACHSVPLRVIVHIIPYHCMSLCMPLQTLAWLCVCHCVPMCNLRGSSRALWCFAASQLHDGQSSEPQPLHDLTKTVTFCLQIFQKKCDTKVSRPATMAVVCHCRCYWKISLINLLNQNQFWKLLGGITKGSSILTTKQTNQSTLWQFRRPWAISVQCGRRPGNPEFGLFIHGQSVQCWWIRYRNTSWQASKTKQCFMFF